MEKTKTSWIDLYKKYGIYIFLVVLVLQLAGVPGVPAFEIPTLSMVQSFKLLG